MAGDFMKINILRPEAQGERLSKILRASGMVVLFFTLAASVAWAHSAMNRFWGEVPVDILISGDVLVVKPLIVPEGVTLTIDKGATVRFEKTASSDNRIVVKGALVVAGTKESPVRFIPKEPGNKWQGISFEAGARGLMQYAVLDGSSKGYGSPPKGILIKEVEVR